MGVRSLWNKRRKNQKQLERIFQQEKEEIELIDQKLKALNEKLDLIEEEKQDLGMIADKIELILEKMEKNRVHEYIELINNKKKLIYINILIGIGRGFGSLIGISLLTAALIYILQQIISLNIPLIGDFIADIVKIVQENLN